MPAGSTRGREASYAAQFVQRDYSLPGSIPHHDRQGLDQPLIGVLTTPADRPGDWVVAGRALVQVRLELTAAGGAASLLDQVVEDPASRLRLRDELGTTAWPQVVVRAGVGAVVPRTVRRPADDVVVQVR